jgi:hypothetical protein
MTAQLLTMAIMLSLSAFPASNRREPSCRYCYSRGNMLQLQNTEQSQLLSLQALSRPSGSCVLLVLRPIAFTNPRARMTKNDITPSMGPGYVIVPASMMACTGGTCIATPPEMSIPATPGDLILTERTKATTESKIASKADSLPV